MLVIKAAARGWGHNTVVRHCAAGVLALSTVLLIALSIQSDPSFAAGNGAANGNGNAGGNGGGNAGGNGKGNPGGNGKSNNNGRAGGNTPSEIAEPASALGLREAGVIHPLADAYAAAERQFGGEVIGATLEQQSASAWNYDLRVVTADGRVRMLSYDAATLALIAVDGEPVE